jgi:DNA primase
MLLEEGLNVKVALFPDGDDPDSFSRKHTTSELEAFLQNAEQDFISFKTKLLSDEAQHDPLKRAALISDVVRSIAAIPDNITRTVYVKECSRLLTIEEDVLSTEVAKLRRKKWWENAAKKPAEGAQEALPAENETETVTATPPLAPAVHEVYTEAAEKELIYYLLKFGDRELPLRNKGTEIVAVAEYIVAGLQEEDLELVNPHYRKLLNEYGKVLQLAADDRIKHFINHPDQDIMRLAIDIFSDHYNLTIKRFVISEEPENNKLIRDIPRTLLVYKSNVAKQKYIEISRQLREAKSEQDKDLLMAKLRSLQELRLDFAEKLQRLTT